MRFFYCPKCNTPDSAYLVGQGANQAPRQFHNDYCMLMCTNCGKQSMVERELIERSGAADTSHVKR